MTSDYIVRLRAELLRAGAAEPAPRRRARTLRRLRPLVPVVAVALLLGAILLLPPGASEEIPAQSAGEAITLSYRVPAGDATQAAQILRERLNAAGIAAEVTAADGTLTIAARDAARADVAALAAPGHFAIYDWERSVLGRDGLPAPADPAVTGGPDAGRSAALSEGRARSRAHMRPGARAIQADRGWFALGGTPALTNADVASARAGSDPEGRPTVALDLTRAGEQAFTTVTRELARRGADQAGSGDPLQTSQHLALVLDDRLVSTPYVNWREAPDGIDGADGAFLSGDRTLEQARLTAALLSSGPLPGPLEPIDG